MSGPRKSRRIDLLAVGGSTLNLTPLLDVIFNLVFFFLLATNIREQDRFLEINLPDSQTAETAREEKKIPEIVLTRDGQVMLDGQAVAWTDLEARLKEKVDRDKVTEVVLSSDSEVAWQKIVDATDACRKAGLREVTPRIRPKG